MIETVDQETTEAAKEAMFISLLGKIGIAFREDVTTERRGVYWERLKRYSHKKLERALNEALDNEQRFPSIAGIRQYIEPLLDPRIRPKEYPDL